MSMDDTFEITIEAMAYGGEGLGRAPDGRMIFVAFTLPGERVRVREIDSHKRWGRAELIQVLETSPDRKEARCRHFGECGGCHYQHTNYAHQLAIKRDILIDQLQRLGGFDEPTVHETVASPQPWNYRNRMRFHVRDDGRLGFYRWNGQGIFALEECHLPQAPIDQIWPQLSLEARDTLTEIEIRVDSREAPMVILHGSGAPDLHLDVEAATSVIWLSDDGQLVLAGDPYGWMEVQGHPFRLSPRSFFQTNTDLVDQLVEMVLQAAAVEASQTAFDLYAGVGLFSAFLAEAGAKIIAVEQSASACSDFEVNLDRYQDISLYEAPTATALATIRNQPDVIVVDPPRAGLDKQVVRQILDFAPDRIIYVSCDPATLARDGKQLAKGGYRLAHATPIDLFPQTFHIESLSLWQKAT